MKNKLVRDLEVAEEEVMLALVKAINEQDDPVDMYNAIKRYDAFCQAREHRLMGERNWVGNVDVVP